MQEKSRFHGNSLPCISYFIPNFRSHGKTINEIQFNPIDICQILKSGRYLLSASMATRPFPSFVLLWCGLNINTLCSESMWLINIT